MSNATYPEIRNTGLSLRASILGFVGSTMFMTLLMMVASNH